MHCWKATGGPGVHREVESEGLEEQYRAVIEGQPVMNRSAKGGARSSRHYGGEGARIHPSNQCVCEQHGTEDLHVTPGRFVACSGGTGITDPISRETKWGRMRGEQSDSRIVPQARRNPRDRVSGGRVGRGSRLAEAVGERADV